MSSPEDQVNAAAAASVPYTASAPPPDTNAPLAVIELFNEPLQPSPPAAAVKAPEDQPVSMGRIVLFTHGDLVQPAIVIAVSEAHPDHVDLRVFSADPAALPHVQGIGKLAEGGDFGWSWPKRI